MIKKITFIAMNMLLGVLFQVQAQVQNQTLELSLEDAMRIALENNHQIQVSKLQNLANQKDVHVGKTGLLPTIDAVAGGNYSNSKTDVTFAGSIPPLDGADATTKGYNAGLQVSYMLFDGLGTFNSYKKLKAAGEISGIQSKISIEGTILQLIANYFEVVRNQDLLEVYNESLKISKERLSKVENNFKYGAAAKIEVLNAQVDYNNDYSNQLNQQQNLASSKRQLNYFLARDLNTEFEVEKEFEVGELANKDSLKALVISNNSSLVLSQLNVNSAEIDKKLALSQFAPKISMNASYGLNYSENSASIMLKSSSLGFTGALSLSWNLFKGMSHKKELEKSKLLIEASEGKKKEAELALEREFLDLYERLQVNIELLNLEKKNIQTAEVNLKRSKELYFNGTLNNVQFRQAQINLLIAQSKLNNLKFQAKLQEYQVLRLSDRLIN